MFLSRSPEVGPPFVHLCGVYLRLGFGFAFYQKTVAACVRLRRAKPPGPPVNVLLAAGAPCCSSVNALSCIDFI